MMRMDPNPKAPALLLLAAVLLFGGCKKKPKVVEPPPQATAPQIVILPEPEPAEPAMPEPSSAAEAATATSPEPPPAPKPKPRRRPPAPVAKTTPPKPAEQAAAEPEPQPPQAPISAAITADASRQQNEIEQMLSKTDANLRGINRELNEEEKAMLRQIESFAQQARDALKVGDTVRAHNLAQKAQLLSTELAKR